LIANGYADTVYHDYNTDDRLLDEQRDKEEDDEGTASMITNADDDELSSTSDAASAPHSQSKSGASLDRQDSFLSSSPSGADASSPSPQQAGILLSRTRTWNTTTKQAALNAAASTNVKKVDDAIAMMLIALLTQIVKKPLPEYNKTASGVMEEFYDRLSKKIARDILFRLSLTNFEMFRGTVEKSITDGYVNKKNFWSFWSTSVFFMRENLLTLCVDAFILNNLLNNYK